MLSIELKLSCHSPGDSASKARAGEARGHQVMEYVKEKEVGGVDGMVACFEKEFRHYAL